MELTAFVNDLNDRVGNRHRVAATDLPELSEAARVDVNLIDFHFQFVALTGDHCVKSASGLWKHAALANNAVQPKRIRDDLDQVSLRFFF
jgi:hypothetical protein